MLVEAIINYVIYIISSLGYFGLVLMMILESMIFPIPSEAIMPFAGFLVAEGKFTFLFVFIASSLGSVIGSLISYYIGLFGANTFLPKYGKYFLLNHEHLEKTSKWFDKNGSKTVFISRFIPVVRHLISIPAGIAKMDLKKFIIYTFIGASIWNMFLAYIGFKLKQNWELLHKYSKQLDIAVIVVIVLFVAYHLIKHIKKKKVN